MFSYISKLWQRYRHCLALCAFKLFELRAYCQVFGENKTSMCFCSRGVFFLYFLKIFFLSFFASDYGNLQFQEGIHLRNKYMKNKRLFNKGYVSKSKVLLIEMYAIQEEQIRYVCIYRIQFRKIHHFPSPQHSSEPHNYF